MLKRRILQQFYQSIRQSGGLANSSLTREFLRVAYCVLKHNFVRENFPTFVMAF